MLKHYIAMGVTLATFAGVGVAQAQKLTERFIPIGQSPGLSGKVTKTGNIEAVSAQEQTVTMSVPPESYSVRVVESTHIWLDKSKLKEPNEVGTMADLKAGRLIEVKFQDNDPNAPAEWIKVQVTD
jgi:hypothetical protein